MIKVRKIVPLFILVLFTGFMLISCNTKNIPLANKGVMDLSNWDFTKKGIINLNGEWEFYWNQLLRPSDFNTDKTKMTGYYNVPSVWNNYESKDIEISGTGYCTLKLVLILPESDYYSLKIREIPTAYRMWINGKESASNGVVAKSKEKAVPQYIPVIKPFKTEKNKRTTIILQISNYHFRTGGFLYGIGLGPSELINRNENQNLMFDLFIFSSVLILGIYHLLLYTQRRQQISALYLGLICLLVSLRPLTTNMQFITTIFPNLSWFIELKLEYSIFIGPFLFSLFVKAIYPEELSNTAIKIIGILTIIIVCLILFTPPIVFSNLTLYFEIVYTVILLYVIIKIILIAFRKREASVLLAIGSSVFFVIMIIDILFYNKILGVGNLLPIGFLLLIITQSYLLTIKFAKSFKKNEQLSNELKLKNEKLKELDSQKDEFLANTSHELKTPLNGIVGIAESLMYGATGDLSESTIKNLSLIVKNGKRLNTIVNEILEFSRLKNNNITLTKTYVDIYQIVEQIILFCKPLADKKNIKLNNEIDKSLPYAFADENRLQQILYNLIGNALKFTYEGEVKLSAIACENNIEISVSDTGIGIPKDKQENIFNSFEQADGSILRIYGGTGLGLSISKELINLHNGSIKVDSEPDKGSVFTFTIPIYKEEIHGKYNYKSSTNNKNSSLEFKPDTFGLPEIKPNDLAKKQNNSNNNKILVVDDDPVNVQVLINDLQLNNYDVEHSSDGLTALSLIENRKYDLIILDIMMPRMSGYELCSRVREKYNSDELPIMILTAKNNTIDIITALDSGANDYLPKPFDIRELISRVNNLIKLKERTEKLRSLNETLEEKITQRTKQLQEANKELKVYSYSVTHDLRNPLSVMHNAWTILQRRWENRFDERTNKIMETINFNINKMNNIITDLLNLSKISNEELIITIFNISRIVRQMADELKYTNPERNIEFIIQPDLMMVGDQRFIKIVMENLISNAFKYTAQEEIAKIEFGMIEKDNEKIYYVKDNGIGFDMEEAQELFKPFKRLNNASVFEGLGIGLSTVERIIHKHNGRIWADSKLNEYTIFYFILKKDLVSKQTKKSG